MKYSLDSPYMPHLIDEYVTGGFDESFGVPQCRSCGADIGCGEQYYDVDGNIYCMRCSGSADKDILESVRDNYIYEY